MIIKLFQPPSRGWLLIAEQLDDPQSWDRFLPSHSATSERWQFDCVAKAAGGSDLKITPCKELLKRGTSVFEYDWQADEGDILFHAMQVAADLGLELLMDAPAPTSGSAGRTAA
jgi:hypothetical protein